MEKTYQLNDCDLHVIFEPKVIRIERPDELNKYLAVNICLRTKKLADLIKNDYEMIFNEPLRIPTNSIIVEIWGHVFASYVAKLMKRKLPFRVTQKLSDFIIHRSDRIDCGEREVDTNRIVWDLLAPFKSVILWLLPREMK